MLCGALLNLLQQAFSRRIQVALTAFSSLLSLCVEEWRDIQTSLVRQIHQAYSKYLSLLLLQTGGIGDNLGVKRIRWIVPSVVHTDARSIVSVQSKAAQFSCSHMKCANVRELRIRRLSVFSLAPCFRSSFKPSMYVRVVLFPTVGQPLGRRAMRERVLKKRVV
ncbi:hypothetical protein DF035_16445 [Burkholderia contaminans]|nr:hypothetical protein DF035_16445 [Burkholderia contaminans]